MFEKRIVKTETCWLWTGSRNGEGHGFLYFDGKTHGAHRVAVWLDGREIPPGMCVDHLCMIKECVNPAHLDVVTPAENSRRSVAHYRSLVTVVRPSPNEVPHDELFGRFDTQAATAMLTRLARARELTEPLGKGMP